MELYTRTAYAMSRLLTQRYSTSFSSSAAIFPKAMRQHIYAIYGLVRIADEIVDTYKGISATRLLRDFQQQTYQTIDAQYSTNPVIHAFAITAATYGISKELIDPFFESMASDLSPQVFTPSRYASYIHGSAEVVGLMCLKVFCDGDSSQYNKLKKGASALGAAYQKVNFLRDIASDYKELGRIYFPGYSFESFDAAAKDAVIRDIEKDFALAQKAIGLLPSSSKTAVLISYRYYTALLKKLDVASIDDIKSRRVRIPAFHKAGIVSATLLKQGIKR